jgi:hypothetical protein
MNWVERKFAREDTLLNSARLVWEEVRTAIADACNSFSGRCDSPTIARNNENGHAVVVRVAFSPRFHPGIAGGLHPLNVVRIEFDEQQNLITSTLNDKSAQKFLIDADENGCFISHQNTRIDSDKLSQKVLEEALFKEPSSPTPQYTQPHREWG